MSTYDNSGNTLTEMRDFGEPFYSQVLKRCPGCEGKAKDHHARIRVHYRAEAIVTLFTSWVPEFDGVGLLVMTKA